jgi:uncharacterized membrane protein YidH (DUF202 family)
VGYRTQNNYDEDAHAARKRLPWRERFDWRLVAMTLVVVAAFVAGLMVRLGYWHEM